MRLGQLARKYDVQVQDVISLINEEGDTQDLHPNSKLDPEVEQRLIDHYEKSHQAEQDSEVVSEIVEDVSDEEINEIEEPEPVQSEEVTSKSAIEWSNELEVVEETVLPIKEEQVEEKSIDSAQLLEMLESEDENLELDDITTIKAPKKELDGLKVVGKIDLPEPKVKTKEELEAEEEAKARRNARRKGNQLTDEEREKRRLRAKRKKEQFEKRQERRRKEEEKAKKKAQREAHYQSRMQEINARKTKPKVRKIEVVQEEPKKQLPEPTTLLGKFIRWFWHAQ